jgi:hypothetical protein
MTKSELKNRIRLQFAGAGHFNAFVTRYGKEVRVLVTDMTLIDAIKSDEPCCGTTPKQALEIIYNKAS